MYTHTNEVKGGKGVPEQYNGVEIALDCPETVAEAVGEGKPYPTERDLLRAANRTLNVERNGVIRDTIIAAHKDGATADQATVIADATAKARALQFKARIVDPNAPKAPKSSGEVKRAKAVASRHSEALLKAIREDNKRGLKTMLDMGFVTQEEIDAARQAVEQEAAKA